MSDTVFTDDQVTSACNLHLDNLRRLITWGAVKPIQAGGGRGRVRKWTARQGLRISVTAQFVEAGFSLQMAHTLTYCLPLDDFLYVYEPDFIRSHLKERRDLGARRLKAMLSPVGKNYWPTKDYLGTEVIIVDRRYVYADVTGDRGTLFVIIDVIDDEFLNDADDSDYDRFARCIPEGVDTSIVSVDSLVCRNLCLINLAVGLTEFIRKLLGLPVSYHPFEESQRRMVMTSIFSPAPKRLRIHQSEAATRLPSRRDPTSASISARHHLVRAPLDPASLDRGYGESGHDQCGPTRG